MQWHRWDLLHSSGRLTVLLISLVGSSGPAWKERFTLTSCSTSLGGFTHCGADPRGGIGASWSCSLLRGGFLCRERIRNNHRFPYDIWEASFESVLKRSDHTDKRERNRSHTMTVEGVEAPVVDPLGNRVYNDDYDYWDGPDLLEGSTHTVWETSPALDRGLQRNVQEQTLNSSFGQFPIQQ